MWHLAANDSWAWKAMKSAREELWLVTEFDPNFNLLQTREFSIDDIHDWTFTDTCYILFGNRVKLDASGSIRAISGLSPMISALSVNPGKQTTPIYLLPRFVTSDGSWRLPVEAPTQLWLLHAANAFDTQDEENRNLCIRIQATACSYQCFKFHQLFGHCFSASTGLPLHITMLTYAHMMVSYNLVHGTVPLSQKS
ncbi:Carotenoid cleavage dioxygenase 7, chloroplastic-like protein [Drosera capensis]